VTVPITRLSVVMIVAVAVGDAAIDQLEADESLLDSRRLDLR